MLEAGATAPAAGLRRREVALVNIFWWYCVLPKQDGLDTIKLGMVGYMGVVQMFQMMVSVPLGLVRVCLHRGRRSDYSDEERAMKR